jgi:Sec-independent protein secretion pathway component TatC
MLPKSIYRESLKLNLGVRVEGVLDFVNVTTMVLLQWVILTTHEQEQKRYIIFCFTIFIVSCRILFTILHNIYRNLMVYVLWKKNNWNEYMTAIIVSRLNTLALFMNIILTTGDSLTWHWQIVSVISVTCDERW